MKNLRTIVSAALVAVGLGLLTGAGKIGENPQPKKPTAPTALVSSDVPTTDDELHEWLISGAYKKFAAQESKAHPSAGPHTKYGLPVRVYLGSKIDASLKAGNEQHPIGSSIVKEMFNAGNELEGWAVMVKTQDESAGGKGWYWYEATSIAPGTKAFASGNGVPLCFGCHAAGTDYVLTKHPLK